jgi:hypothetical protein
VTFANDYDVDLTDYDALMVPYVTLATSPTNSNVYTFAPETYFDFSPIPGNQNYPEFSIVVRGVSDDLNVTLEKGTKVLICLGMKLMTTELGIPEVTVTVGCGGSILAEVIQSG